MKDKIGNPQAFPRNETILESCENISKIRKIHYLGMDLRDYFAGQMLASYEFTGSATEIAEHCYNVADAMILERSKKV